MSALLDAVAGARRRHQGGAAITLEILGDGPERGRLELQSRRLGLGEVVTFLGEGDEGAVRAVLSRGDLFVNACPVESFGLGGLEALARGLPVVGRAEGGMEAFVVHGRNGLLVDSDEALEDALVRLATDEGELKILRSGAARGIPEELTWSHQVERHLDLYEAMSPSASPSS